MEYKTRLISDNYVLQNSKLIGAAKNINAVFSIDYNTGETSILGIIPEKINCRVCSKVIPWNDCYIIIPQKGENVWVLKENKVLKRMKVPFFEGRKEWKFFQAEVFDNNLFMIGADYPAILKINLESFEYKNINVYEHLYKKKNIFKDVFSRNSFVINEGKMYIPSALSNEVLCLNILTDDFRWYRIGQEGMRYSGIAWDGNNFWLSSRTDTCIVKWDGDRNFDIITTSIIGGDASLLGVTVFGDNVYCPGMVFDKSFIINRISNKVSAVDEGHFTFCQNFDNNILVMQKDNGEISIEFKNGVKNTFYPELFIDDLKKYWNEFGVSNLDLLKIIDMKEGVVLTLKSYINELASNA